MVKNKRFAFGIIAVTALILSGGSAYAGSSNENYDVIMPLIGGFAYTAAQTQNYSNSDGYIKVATVGSDYKIDARMCRTAVNTCLSQVSGLTDGSTANLPGGVVTGTGLKLGLNVSTWNSVTVQSTGYWRTN